MDKTGYIKEKLSFSFEWEIHDCFSFSNEMEVFYDSPDFDFAGATWCLTIYPNGDKAENSEWISLFLIKLNPGSLKHVMTYTMSVKDADGKDYICLGAEKEEFDGADDSSGWPNYLKRSILREEKERIAPNGVLTISCSLIWDSCPAEEAHQISAQERIYDGIERKVKSMKYDNEDEDDDIFFIIKGIDKLIQDFKDMLLRGEESNVIIKVKDHEFRAHRLILGARSPVFCSMFKDKMAENSNSIVNITDIDPDIFREFLFHLYSGRIETISACNVLSLYSVAYKYQAKDLMEQCIDFMKRNLSLVTFCDILGFSLRHNESKLREIVTAFFMKNVKQIILTAQWQSFMKENFAAANELYIKSLEQLDAE